MGKLAKFPVNVSSETFKLLKAYAAEKGDISVHDACDALIKTACGRRAAIQKYATAQAEAKAAAKAPSRRKRAA